MLKLQKPLFVKINHFYYKEDRKVNTPIFIKINPIIYLDGKYLPSGLENPYPHYWCPATHRHREEATEFEKTLLTLNQTYHAISAKTVWFFCSEEVFPVIEGLDLTKYPLVEGGFAICCDPIDFEEFWNICRLKVLEAITTELDKPELNEPYTITLFRCLNKENSFHWSNYNKSELYALRRYASRVGNHFLVMSIGIYLEGL